MAVIAKKFFDLLVEKNLRDKAKVEKSYGDHISYLKEILRKNEPSRMPAEPTINKQAKETAIEQAKLSRQSKKGSEKFSGLFLFEKIKI